jgi:hypothetical protein
MNELMKLPEGTITTYGLNFPQRIDDELIKAIAERLQLLGEAGGWGEADLVEALMRQYPADWKYRLDDLAEYLGRHPATLKLRWQTGRTFPTYEEREELYRQNITFEKCRMISAYWISADQREGLLEQLRSGMTVRDLEEELRRLRGQPMLPSRDAPPIRERVGGWLDTLNESDRGYAEYYVKLFVDWLESSQTTPNP